MKHSYWDRTATNTRILKEATRVTYREGTEAQVSRNKNREVQQFSVTYQAKRTKLMAHILRWALLYSA